MLEKIKTLLNIKGNDFDDLISLLIDYCKEEATQYCNLDEYTEVLDYSVIRMVVETYNRRGNEGYSSFSFGGVSNSILTNYSEATLASLRKHRKLKKIR